MNKFYVTAFTMVFALSIAQPAAAADPQAGKQTADQVCSACHGKDGVSIAALYPNLCGQKAEYLVTQLEAFRSGTRVNPIMAPMAKNLSDADIANLGAYFSALKCP